MDTAASRLFMVKRLICCVVIVLVGLFLALSFFKMTLLNQLCDPFIPVAETTDDSREKGLLISVLRVMPEQFELSGGMVEVQEAWIEAEVITDYTLGWLPHYRTTGHSYFCLRIKMEHEAMMDNKPEFLCEGGDTKYFAQTVSGNRKEIFCWKWFASLSDYPKYITVEAPSRRHNFKPLVLTIDEPKRENKGENKGDRVK